jgi:hypothetical protein
MRRNKVNALEVYTHNILPRQIVKRIGCRIDDTEAIAKERGNFLRFLVGQSLKGITYPTQLNAWEAYDGQSIPEIYSDEELSFLLGSDFEPRDYVNRELTEIEEAELIETDIADWVSEIHKILLEQAQKAGVRDLDVDNLYYTRIHEAF